MTATYGHELIYTEAVQRHSVFMDTKTADNKVVLFSLV
jgi:hypothetical protein